MLESIANWIIHVISTLGYPGIILTMAIESALIPLPSEVIMPFSGFLVTTGRFDLWLVALSGATGNLIGSWIAYALGYWGNERIVRRLIRKFGKFVLISEDELDLTEKWLHKYKDTVILTSRVMPGLRTVISLPAGIAKLPLLRFSILTFAGSFAWSLALAYVGVLAGANWQSLRPIFQKFDLVIVIGVVGLVGYYIWHKVKR